MKISKHTRNVLAYIIGSTVVLFGTLVLAALATGWHYDFTTGEIRDTGLIIMNSEPSGATITVNNEPIKNKTPFRYASVLPGTYEISFTKAGFRPWFRRTLVEAEQVTFNDFAWLLPIEVPSRLRYPDSKIIDAIQTIDRKRNILVSQPVTTAKVPIPPQILVSTDWARPTALLYAPSVIPALATGNIAPSQVTNLGNLSLSNDGANLLVRQTTADSKAQWLIMPTNPSDNLKITNLSIELGATVEPTWTSWGPSGSNELFLIIDGQMKRWLVNEHRLEDLGINNLAYANWDNDRLITIETQTDATNLLLVRNKDALTSPEVIGPVPNSTSYTTEYFRWLNDDYVAVLDNSSQQLFITRNIFLNKSARVTSLTAAHVSNFTINRSGRYIVFSQNNRFVLLDIERNQRARWQADLTGLTRWEWFNDQHLVMEIGHQLRFIDYDGQNNELIASNLTGTSPILFADNKSILSFVTGSPIAQLTHYFLNPDKIIE